MPLLRWFSWGWASVLGMSSPPPPLVQLRENPEFHALIQKGQKDMA